MPHLIATRGLPGSGKTTWAKQWITDQPAGQWVRVNKDCLRSMLYFGRYEASWEARVKDARDVLVGMYLDAYLSVVVDDTNFGAHTSYLAALAEVHGATFEIRDFTDVPLTLCIERDARRLPRVGEDVILGMHRRYLAGSESAGDSEVSGGSALK